MIEYYSHNKLEDWKTSFLQMTCKSNEQRKLAFYVMTQPLCNCSVIITASELAIGMEVATVNKP